MYQTTISNQYEVNIHKHIIKLCHSLMIPLHYNHKGPKIFKNYQRIGLILLYIRSKKSLIDFIEELKETKWPSWLGLKEIPGKSTLNDWMKLFNVSIIRKFLSKQIEKEKPKIMAIDATGIDSWQRSRHYERRVKQCGIHMDHLPYAKADILMDTDTYLIHDWVLRIKPRHDVLGAETIFKKLKVKKTLILADRGYDSEPLHKLVQKMGNILHAPVRNMKKNPKGFNRKRCAKRNDSYSRKNVVESLMHALKSMKPQLKSKLHHVKKKEFRWTIILLNIKRIINSLFELFFKCYSGCTLNIQNYLYYNYYKNTMDFKEEIENRKIIQINFDLINFDKIIKEIYDNIPSNFKNILFVSLRNSKSNIINKIPLTFNTKIIDKPEIEEICSNLLSMEGLNKLREEINTSIKSTNTDMVIFDSISFFHKYENKEYLKIFLDTLFLKLKRLKISSIFFVNKENENEAYINDISKFMDIIIKEIKDITTKQKDSDILLDLKNLVDELFGETTKNIIMKQINKKEPKKIINTFEKMMSQIIGPENTKLQLNSFKKKYMV